MTSGALKEHSEGIQKALREQSESNQREREQSDFIIPSEPEILRLVVKKLTIRVIITSDL